MQVALSAHNPSIFVDALGKHPLCHRLCKVTKETSGANNIVRNAINSTSITFDGLRVVLGSPSFPRLRSPRKPKKMAASRERVIIWSKLGHGRQNVC